MKRIFYALSVSIKQFGFLTFIASFVFCATAKAQTGPFSLFASETPATESNDGQALAVGFKFKVTQVGSISAIRFYKNSGNGNNTLYTVNLWTNGNSTTPGTSLGSASNSTITGSGWKQINISSVTLQPGNVYVISLFSSSGWYSYTNNYFPTNADDFSRPPFIMIANNTDPAGVGNGVWRYTVANAFPFNSGNTTNYFIDLVFNTTFALPVTLSDFKATTSTNNILVSWKTDHEFNNKGFEIQRSNNGSDWYAINFIDGSGETTTTKNYSYTDKGLAPGTYFYRLKQVDFDGNKSFSSIVSATVSGKGSVTLFQNYPNPFASTTSIRFDLPTAQHARLSILDLSGREVKVLTDKTSEAGSHMVTLDATKLGHQTYIIRLQTESGVLTKKILVK